jgi:two-component system OmpR family sensor kinase
VVRVRGPVPPVALDSARLEQILQNLLENAAKYAPGATPIQVDVDGDAAGVCVRVIDQGPGIDPDDLPRVFDRFYQSTSARERKNGFGLGLFITKGLVVAHGGRIDVESERCRGSVFRIWFPAAS